MTDQQNPLRLFVIDLADECERIAFRLEKVRERNVLTQFVRNDLGGPCRALVGTGKDQIEFQLHRQHCSRDLMHLFFAFLR